jgi:signal transduction histidine kinase
VSQALTHRDPDALLAEMRAQGASMLRVATGLGTIAFAGMWLVDPALASGDDLFWCRVVRVAACGSLTTMFVASFFGDWATRWARGATIAAALITGVSVIALTYFTGGGDSDYHEALHVTFFGYAMLPAPWRRRDASLVFVSLLGLYDAVLLLGARLGPVGSFLTHNALLGLTVLTSVVLRRLLISVRQAELDRRSELAAANARLTALDEAKSRFFANLSHELRTPLTLALAPLEAVIESPREPLTDGQREKLQLAHRNALRLLRLVDDLLALTRAEAASLRLHVQDTDLPQLVHTLAGDIRELAARKQVTLEVDTEPDLPPVEADPQLVERVLLNVVGNALKFTREGQRVRIAARRQQHDDVDGVLLEVADQGVGIAPKDLPHIFTRFYQGDSGSTRAFGGTGIGLALVRELVELHGGHVAAESAVGQGTTIRAWLPVRLPPTQAVHAVRASEVVVRSSETGLPEWHEAIRTARSYRYQGIEDATERRVAPRPRPKGHAPTVLVVEDNPDMIRFLVALLAHDFHVISARNGVQGLRLAVERQPDIIISDVMMPEMDGFEMARRLRESTPHRDIPLIFLTARGSPEDRLAGHVQGADTYLPKPFRGEELLAAVDALVSRRRVVRDAAASRQDEALVYMASGLVDVLGGVEDRLRQLRELAPAAPVAGDLAGALVRLEAVSGALHRLARAGSASLDVPTDVAACVRTALARCGPRSSEVDVQVPNGLQVHLREDELVDVVQALLTRAFAVTPRGRSVAVTAGTGANDRALLTVTDEGPSLTPAQVDRLFFPFHELLGPGASAAEGVAMSYAFRVVKARGGTLGVEISGDSGTAVVLGLPLAREGVLPT